MRKKGDKNIQCFDQRGELATTAAQEIKHLAYVSGETPFVQFESILAHQAAYLKWIEDRHQELLRLKKAGGSRGPKDAVYKKYRWYAEQQTLFETINAFEVFYKRTFVNLGSALRRYIPPERMKGTIDARVLWAMTGRASVAALFFESNLYHDLDQVDKATNALIEMRRYNVGDPRSPQRETVRCLHAIFQIRHTLAHNQGVVTLSDKAKFGFYRLDSAARQVIDPSKDALGKSVRKYLSAEAKCFTDWILDGTATYLKKVNANSGVPLKMTTLDKIERTVGFSQKLRQLAWS